MRPVLTVEDIETGRWDHLVAADSGRGWCRAMFVVVDHLSVRIHVLRGSELLYSGSDSREAVRVYNAARQEPETVRAMCPLVGE